MGTYPWAATYKIHRFLALWALHGKAAGPIRNVQMMTALLEEDGHHVVLAFPGGTGTADMVRIAEQHGVDVRRYEGVK